MRMEVAALDSLIVRGGRRIEGRIRVDRAKNAVLPQLAAAVLADGPVVLRDVPWLLDIRHMLEILQLLGVQVSREGGQVVLDASSMTGYEMPDELSKQLRSSIFMLGPLLARFRRATVTYPGGCEIGLRPIDLHLAGLRSLGVQIEDAGGVIHCDGSHMHPGAVHLDYPSVGATENVMMAAALLDGETVIHNAAREPEILDLQGMINAMGGDVRGAGSSTVIVRGVARLHGAAWTPMPDRIVAGTLLAAAAITGGEICLTDAPAEHMTAVTAKMQEMGCVIRTERDTLILSAPPRLRAFSLLQTQPHPGFPTDMQAQMLALLTTADGTGMIVENVFENRFAHAGDMNRMGARILVKDRTAVVQGVRGLTGMKVTARDLRGGAALVLCGLRAEGETCVEQACLIDRGYDGLERQLASLGADIERTEKR